MPVKGLMEKLGAAPLNDSWLVSFLCNVKVQCGFSPTAEFLVKSG